MNNSAFTAYYNPDTQQVRLTCSIGPLTCCSTIPLETYTRRQAAWPGLYPQAVTISRA